MLVHAGPVNSHYKLERAEAAELQGIVSQPSDVRQELLRRYAEARGSEALAHLFAEFIGLANSVEDNAQSFLWVAAIVDGKMSDREVEKLNMPTIAGALAGVHIAIEPVKGMCGGCAYRLGTHANQSPCTTEDAQYVFDCNLRFRCHDDLDEDGEPTRECAGYEWKLKQLQKERAVCPI
jgi:hypothetical protein